LARPHPRKVPQPVAVWGRPQTRATAVVILPTDGHEPVSLVSIFATSFCPRPSHPPPALLWSGASAAPGRCLPAGELRGPAESGVRLRPLAARPPRARRPRPLQRAPTQRPHRCAFGGEEGSGPQRASLGWATLFPNGRDVRRHQPSAPIFVVGSQCPNGCGGGEGQGEGSCPQRARVRVPVPPDGHAAGGRPRRPPRPALPALRGVGPVSVRTVEPGGGGESRDGRNSEFFQALEYSFLQRGDRESTFVPTRIQYPEPNSSPTSTYKPASQDCGRIRSVTQVFGHWLVQRSFGLCTRRTPSAMLNIFLLACCAFPLPSSCNLFGIDCLAPEKRS